MTPSAQERGLPRNLDAEQAVLAACLLDGGRDVMTQCIEAHLAPKHFYAKEHKVVFQVMRDLYEQGNPTDEVVVADALQSRKLSSLKGFERNPSGEQNCLEFIDGYSVIAEIVDRIETTAHASYWIGIVLEKASLRDLIRTCNRVVHEAHEVPGGVDEFLEQVEQRVFAISQERIQDEAQPLAHSIDQATATLQAMLEGKPVADGLKTGFVDLDKMTWGMRRGEMVVLAARPSMGKTALAINIAENVTMPTKADCEAPAVLVFSLEMTAEQLAMRMLCCRARVSTRRLRDGFPEKGSGDRLGRASNELRAAPLLIDQASYVTVLDLRAKARRLASQHPLGLVIVDYLQLISGTDGRVQREQQIAEISRGLKAMAKELAVPVLVLSQLNRESEKEKRLPRLSDLRESGAIEQDADVVLILAAPKAEYEEAQIPQAADRRILIIAKNRNGPVGNVDLTFISDYTRFENYAPVEA